MRRSQIEKDSAKPLRFVAAGCRLSLKALIPKLGFRGET